MKSISIKLPIVLTLLMMSAIMNIAYSQSKFRIMSYNIRNCIGMDTVKDFDRVAKVISDNKPDFVAIQEVDSVTKRSKGIDILKVLSQKTNMNYLFGPSLDFQNGKYGIGVLSKEKPTNSKFIHLPGKEERRGLLIAEYKDFIFFCTHLSLTKNDRIESARIINNYAKEYSKPIILAGDFNDTCNSEAIDVFSKNWELLSLSKPTFPSNAAKICIDYIWKRRDNIKCKVIEKTIINENKASDHLPIYVDIKLKK